MVDVKTKPTPTRTQQEIEGVEAVRKYQDTISAV